MRRSLVAAALAAALPVSAAFAQDARVLSGKDDLAFAGELARHGYPDLAKSLLDVVRKKADKPSRDDAATMRAIELVIAFDAARDVPDLLARIDAVSSVAADMEKFAAASAGTSAGDEIRDGLSDVYEVLSDAYSVQIRKTSDPKAADALRRRGVECFGRYEELLAKRIEELKAASPPSPDALQSASYSLPRALHLHAMILPAGGDERRALHEKAVKTFDDFLIDYEGEPLGYWAEVDEGACLADLGRVEDAEQSYDAAIRLRETYGAPDAKTGVYPIADRGGLELVCRAFLGKAELFRERKRTADLVASARDYFRTTPKPFDAAPATELACALADGLLETRAFKECADLATRMIDADPNGAGGARGREILARVPGAADWKSTLRLAAARSERGEFDDALVLCRRVLADEHGSADEALAEPAAMSVLGSVFERRGWFEEAATAYEAAGANADAIVHAIDCYSAARSASPRKLYATRIQEAVDRLAVVDPKNSKVQHLILVRAKGLEAEGDWKGAVALYDKVDPASDEFTTACVRKAAALVQVLLAQKPDQPADEAKDLAARAEAALDVAGRSVGQRRAKTLDARELAALDGEAFAVCMLRAQVLTLPAVARFDEAAKVLDDAAARWGEDPVRGPQIRRRRGALYIASGDLEKAELWVDDLAKHDPRAAAGPAGQVARALDAKAVALRASSAREADDLWRIAARYYRISMAPQVSGAASPDVDEMTAVGGRLFVFGLRFNAVPESQTTFVPTAGAALASADCFTQAAEVFEAALVQSPSYRTTIVLGRTYGFLGRWADAARVYGRLFEQESVVDPKNANRLDPAVTRAKPELVPACLEWATAERLLARDDHDRDRLDRCVRICNQITHTVRVETSPELWWAAKYQLVLALVDRGARDEARLVVEDVRRNVSADFDGGTFGYRALFEKALAELK